MYFCIIWWKINKVTHQNSLKFSQTNLVLNFLVSLTHVLLSELSTTFTRFHTKFLVLYSTLVRIYSWYNITNTNIGRWTINTAGSYTHISNTNQWQDKRVHNEKITSIWALNILFIALYLFNSMRFSHTWYGLHTMFHIKYPSSRAWYECHRQIQEKGSELLFLLWSLSTYHEQIDSLNDEYISVHNIICVIA